MVSSVLVDNDTGYVLFQMVVLVRPISSRDRSFGPNRSGPMKKRTVRVTAYMVFHSPAKDLRYAEVNLTTRYTSVLCDLLKWKYITSFSHKHSTN